MRKVFKSLSKPHNKVSTKVTYLNHLVPATGDDDGVAAVGGEANTRHPLSVALILQNKELCEFSKPDYELCWY